MTLWGEGFTKKNNIEGGLPKKEGLDSLPIQGGLVSRRGGSNLNVHYGIPPPIHFGYMIGCV